MRGRSIRHSGKEISLLGKETIEISYGIIFPGKEISMMGKAERVLDKAEALLG